MSFSQATVIEAKPLNPRLRRIARQVEDPETLGVKQAGVSAAPTYFPDSGGEGRHYSVRSSDGARIAVKIVLHACGIATACAAGARTA
ncbi:hypothetical protein H7J08_10010 [Mycobacterium frederiksbergense]|uniref:hypothetical protein n=1 Tax=Mycolicibacterium frederiksbergense TaxID=117567 RepID=UPI0021F33786|nr:hypothetical protein [Mycolicibacterium frederiksbergense]MCV7045002.1 hypothetical protein [Mycolicibacterium frederiksbergense]